MPREFRITVPCQADQPDKDILKVRFTRTDLNAPKEMLWGPYSNPDGDDNRLLRWTLSKKEKGELLDDAVKFYFDFKEDQAIFSFDPNKVRVLDDKGFFEFELEGKYKFKDKVRIQWEKDSLIKAELYVEKDVYELGDNHTRVGYIKVSPKTKNFASNIDVNISFEGVLGSFVEIDRNFVTLINGRSEHVIVSIKKEAFKQLPDRLVIGKVVFSIENINNSECVDFAVGTEEQVNQTEISRVVLLENNHLSVSTRDEEIDLFDEDNPVGIYINQKPTIVELVLKTTLTETNAKMVVVPVCNDDNILISSSDFDKGFVLMESEEKIVRISIAPDTKASTICQLIKLESDYSSPCTKRVYVQTKEQLPPIGHLEFDFYSVGEDDNPEPYYIGSGKEKIGTLLVVNEKADSACHKEIILPPVCNHSFVTLEDQKKSGELVGGQKTVYYDVYVNISESDNIETDDDDLLSMIFSCDCLPTISKSLQVKKKEPEPISIIFKPNEHIEYKQKEKILVGYLTVQYTQLKSKRYFHRNNRNLQIDSTGILFIDCKKNGSQLQIEEGKFPVYYNSAVKFSGKKNLDEIEYVRLELPYADSIDKRRMILFEFDIHPIEATPQSNVYVSSRKNKKVIWENGSIKPNEQWTYQFDSRARNNARSSIIGSICFANMQDIPYNGFGVFYKGIKIYGKYLNVQHDSDIFIPNGNETKDFPIEIVYDQIPVADNTYTVLHIKYELYINEKVVPVEDDIPITIIENVTDDWYSLDLGTTGIVVARWNATNPDETTPIELKDEDNPIEKEPTIVSSKTILMDCEEDDIEDICECVVRPNVLDLKQKATFVLVPSKFLVGQAQIPFANLYKSNYKKGIRINQRNNSWNEVRPETILQYTYGKIFDMVDDDCRKSIRKLIVTYPNTYTPSALTWLRNSIIPSNKSNVPKDGLFPILTHGNLHFIPESDAVVAFYVNQEINGVTSMKDEENIIIYDMGAGTLDLSYVHIENRKNDSNTKRYATILKRIGIPIAGEFFSFLLYKQLEKKLGTSSMTTIKEWIDLLKKEFDTSKTYGNVLYNTSVFSDPKSKEENMEIGPELESWLSICSDDIFVQLLGEGWQSEVDKIVFSGRGSQFAPLRKKIEEQVADKEKIDTKSIPSDCLKQCVAKGALLYQRIFENSNMPFEMAHKNTYFNLGIKYRVLNSFTKEWRYDELVGEDDYVWDEQPINGAFHAVVNIKTNPLDLSQDADVTFYLTPLSQTTMRGLLMNQDDCKWCFVNELFKLNPSFLDPDDRENAIMTISIDKDNRLSIVLNEEIDLLEHTTAPNVEENRFFSLCNDYLNKK